MKLQPGTIYFVRESDAKSSEHSDLVKIGLVSGDRSPFERLREHQTGNPRRLIFDESQFVWTDAVEFVESQLHSKFAKQRVSGEWFQFSTEEEVGKAVNAAGEFAKQAAAIKPLLQRADELNWKPSEGEVHDSTDEARLFGGDYSRAAHLIDVLEQQIADVRKAVLLVAAEEGEVATKEFFRHVEYTTEPSFSVPLLKEKYGKEMYDAYAFQEPKWDPKFEVISPLVPNKEFEAAQVTISGLESQILKARTSHDVFLLNELDLEIRTLLAPQTWKQLYAEANLKNLCGLRPGIQGVCNWIREETLSNKKLDKGRLFMEKPEVYEESFVPGKKVTRKIRMPFKK